MARTRIRREGYGPGGRKLWLPEEDDVCRAIYPDYSVLRQLLPHRSYSALRSRCRGLGLTPRRHIWTGRELSLLRRYYPNGADEELARALPWASKGQIIGAARQYGIHRKAKPFKSTGVEILDAIRRRCFELRYSMGDLDAMCRSRGYFAKAQWHAGWINYRAITRAIKELDGEVAAKWRDPD